MQTAAASRQGYVQIIRIVRGSISLRSDKEQTAHLWPWCETSAPHWQKGTVHWSLQESTTTLSSGLRTKIQHKYLKGTAESLIIHARLNIRWPANTEQSGSRDLPKKRQQTLTKQKPSCTCRKQNYLNIPGSEKAEGNPSTDVVAAVHL